MRILNDRRFPLMSVFVLLIVFTPSRIISQVIIKERVEISPKPPVLKVPRLAVTEGEDLLIEDPNPFLTFDQVITTRPGAVVSATVSFTPGSWVNGAVDLWAHVGGQNVLIAKIERGQCQAGPVQVTGVSGIVLPNCFNGMSISANAWSPFFATCLEARYLGVLRSVGGGSAVFEVGSHSPPFTATVTFTATVDPGYAAATMSVVPELDELACGGSSKVNVELRNARGELYTCPVQAEAVLTAQGPYAYLVAGGQSGDRVQFGLSGGRGSFMVELDVSRGNIPGGFDPAGLSVTVEGITESKVITLRCVEELVVDHFVVTAGDDTLEHGNSTPLTIVARDAAGRETLGDDQDFLVTLSLEGAGGLPGNFAATISSPFDTTLVFPGPFTFSYATYRSGVFSIAYIANGDVPTGSDPGMVTIRVELTNDPEVYGEKQVVVRRERGCENAPQCGEPPSAPEVTLREVPSGFAGYDPCNEPSTSGEGKRAGIFFPVIRPSGKLFEPFNVEPCFNGQHWQFAVSNIQINVIRDICRANLQEWKLIDGTESIPDNDVCSAIQDLEGHRTYPPRVKVGGYLFRSVLLLHEQVHKEKFEKYMVEAKSSFDVELLAYQPKCEELQDPEAAQEQGKRRVEFFLSNFRENFIGKWGRETGTIPANEELHNVDEQETHGSPRIKQLLKTLLESLKARCK